MLQLFKSIDAALDRTTMYRVVLYYLLALVGAAAALAFFGVFSFSPAEFAFSTVVILAVCALLNLLFAKAFGSQTNVESVYITAFILALIMNPVSWSNAAGIGGLVFASAWAIGSKFIIAYRHKHLFNPAAFGVAAAALAIGESATWWVGGNTWMLPLVVLGGVLVIRKMRRFDLVTAFFAATVATVFLTAQTSPATIVGQMITHAPVFFFAFAMLSEPLTMPGSRLYRIVYGIITGIMFAPTYGIAGFSFSPEEALLIGNLFVFLVSRKERFELTLVERIPLCDGSNELVFSTSRRGAFSFVPGQYIEWTLGHKYPDNRGNRRYFTIASSPEDEHIRFGIKFYDKPSSFKSALSELPQGGVVSVSDVAGDFVLPRNRKRKLAFIAGGIGITPFASMTRHLLDAGEARDIVLLYGSKCMAEAGYADVFDKAGTVFHMKTTYVFSDEEPDPESPARKGFVDRGCIEGEIPDWRERTFYISGPHGMVTAVERSLRELGVPRRRIKKDFFPGLA